MHTCVALHSWQSCGLESTQGCVGTSLHGFSTTEAGLGLTLTPPAALRHGGEQKKGHAVWCHPLSHSWPRHMEMHTLRARRGADAVHSTSPSSPGTPLQAGSDAHSTHLGLTRCPCCFPGRGQGQPTPTLRFPARKIKSLRNFGWVCLLERDACAARAGTGNQSPVGTSTGG